MNLFNFLSKEQLIALAKEKLKPVIENHKKSLKESVELYIETKSPSAKEWVIGFIMKKIELPWYLKLFKKTVQNKLEKGFDDLVSFIIERIEKV